MYDPSLLLLSYIDVAPIMPKFVWDKKIYNTKHLTEYLWEYINEWIIVEDLTRKEMDIIYKELLNVKDLFITIRN